MLPVILELPQMTQYCTTEILKSPFIYLKILYPYTAITGFLWCLQDSITCLVLSYCTLWDYVLSFITLLCSRGSRYLDIDTLCSFFYPLSL